MTVELTLITVMPGEKNDNGYETECEYQNKVIAERMSVKRTEFYEAHKAGLKPTVIYRMHPLDFPAGATIAVEHGVRYEIIRTYETADAMELTCARVT